MLDAELRAVARELDDDLLWSLDDLRQKLKERNAKIQVAEETLQGLLVPLPDHPRLALRCMITRDIFHIAALYETFLCGMLEENKSGASELSPEELTDQDEPSPVLPFAEWLFEP